MIFGKKKVINPKIAEFEEDMKSRGKLLVHGRNFTETIRMSDTKEFLRFACRSNVQTVFKDASEYFRNIHYFYVADGVVVEILLLKKVKPPKEQKRIGEREF